MIPALPDATAVLAPYACGARPVRHDCYDLRFGIRSPDTTAVPALLSAAVILALLDTTAVLALDGCDARSVRYDCVGIRLLHSPPDATAENNAADPNKRVPLSQYKTLQLCHCQRVRLCQCQPCATVPMPNVCSCANAKRVQLCQCQTCATVPMPTLLHSAVIPALLDTTATLALYDSDSRSFRRGCHGARLRHPLSRYYCGDCSPQRGCDTRSARHDCGARSVRLRRSFCKTATLALFDMTDTIFDLAFALPALLRYLLYSTRM